MASLLVTHDRARPVTSRPLAPLEQLMLAEARPGHPHCFFIECDVEGILDEARLRMALTAAALRHPLVRSRVRWHGGRPHWLEPDVTPALLWHPAASDRPWGPPDLAAESGVRLVVLQGATRDGRRVILQVQHAVCDGLAALAFLGDVWAVYAGLEPPPFSPPRRPGDATASAPATTTVEMRDGESFAIAGLLQDDFRDLNGQVPWLGDIPVLGALFRSTEYQRAQSELVIIVTPHLVTPTRGEALAVDLAISGRGSVDGVSAVCGWATTTDSARSWAMLTSDTPRISPTPRTGLLVAANFS